MSSSDMKNTTHTFGKASILAIGTELTTGQTTNRNAAWISSQLDSLHIETVVHITVADNHARIKEALEHCARVSQLIFVTGGLGPTTDDFTREVIASWLEKKLIFNEASWQRILNRLTGVGIPVAPSNRQQCFFPEGCEIIPNPDGTASAFSALFGQDSQAIWVLPGPPREVSAVWKNGIREAIEKKCPPPPEATSTLQLAMHW